MLSPHPPITIVSGVPRSGTSMMMRMLEAGGMPVLVDGLRAADEDNPRGYYEFEPVKRTRTDPSWLEAASGKAVKMVYRLLYDLPAGHDYRVLLMQRDLGEVVASQRAMLQRQGKPAGAATDEQMAEYFAGELQRLDQWLAAQPHFAVLRLAHRDCLEEPWAVLDSINQFLSGQLDVPAMARVVDPALYRQRREAIPTGKPT